MSDPDETMPCPICREAMATTVPAGMRHMSTHDTATIYRWMWSLNPATAVLTALASVLLAGLVVLVAYVAVAHG